MAAQGLPCSIAGVAQAYEDFLDVLVCDYARRARRRIAPQNGLRVQCTQTIMRTAKTKRRWRAKCLRARVRRATNPSRAPVSAAGTAIVILVPIKNTSSAKQRLASGPRSTGAHRAGAGHAARRARPPAQLGKPAGGWDRHQRSVCGEPGGRVRLRNDSRPRQSRRNGRDRDGDRNSAWSAEQTARW